MSKGESTHNYNSVPCWLNQPFSEKSRGVVAVTSQYGSGDLLALSRYQALKGLAELFDLELGEDLDLSSSTFPLGKKNLRLAPSWSDNGQHYSYAYLADTKADKWVLNSCSVSQCLPERCSPDWLCYDSEDNLSTVTVSQLSANLREQYRFLFENALDQYQSLHGVQIYAERTQLLRHASSGMRLESSVREIEHAQLEFAAVATHYPLVLTLTHTCRFETTIYGRFELLGYVQQGSLNTDYPADWHLGSIYPEGYIVGHFSGFLSRNLISLKIQQAIRYGLLDLMRSKHTYISSDQVVIERNAEGYYSIEFVHETTKGKIRAQVQSIRFTGTAHDPQVYVLLKALPD
ncbi:MAG: hypothetical protein IBX55_19795 [Methyloprofundus sp.]|nr:hypothetical protein [Methyloprofundus sp.]